MAVTVEVVVDVVVDVSVVVLVSVVVDVSVFVYDVEVVEVTYGFSYLEKSKGRSALCIWLSGLAIQRSLDAIVLESRGRDEEGCAWRAIQGSSGFWNDERRGLGCLPCDYGYVD